MKAILRKYLGETVECEEIVELPDNYDGNPYGDTVPFAMASNWSLQVLDDSEDPENGLKEQQEPEPDVAQPPEGYRLLSEGEYVHKNDIYIRNGVDWLPCQRAGGKWCPKNHWPMARKIDS